MQLLKWIAPESFGQEFIDYLYRKAVQKMYPRGIDEQVPPVAPEFPKDNDFSQTSYNPSLVKLEELEEIADMEFDSRGSEVKSLKNVGSRNYSSAEMSSVFESLRGSNFSQMIPRRTAMPQHLTNSTHNLTVSTTQARMTQDYRPPNNKKPPTGAAKQLAQFWTPEADDKLMTQFKSLPGFTELSISMVKAYPNQKDLLNRQRCRTRIFTLLRRALRKLGNLRMTMRQHGVPEMVQMNHERNHFFLYHRDNKVIKEKLLDFYRSDHVTKAQYVEMVLGVNEKVHQMDYVRRDKSSAASARQFRKSQKKAMGRAVDFNKKKRPIQQFAGQQVGRLYEYQDQHNQWMERKYQ